MASLCVNIDHIATLRQARRETEPDPVLAIGIVERAGSTGVTMHLREDRRHVQDRDVRLAREVVQGRLNLEMAATEAMLAVALEIKPDLVTLVPERREEVTTEGGLEVAGRLEPVRRIVQSLMDAGIGVSMFIAPDAAQIEASKATGAAEVEFHTGAYAHAWREEVRRPGAGQSALSALYRAASQAREMGLIVNAGHGLNEANVRQVAAIPEMKELNIGHAIISRAVFDGLFAATQSMANIIESVTRRPEPWRLAQ